MHPTLRPWTKTENLLFASSSFPPPFSSDPANCHISLSKNLLWLMVAKILLSDLSFQTFQGSPVALDVEVLFVNLLVSGYCATVMGSSRATLAWPQG